MKIQTLKLSELKPLEVNVRKHTEAQIKEIVRSVQQFGQTRAIVIDEKNNILIGNGLHEAMVKAGLEEAFVYRKKGLSEIEKKKLILADNKTYSLGADDYGNIEAYLEEITASGDFEIAGFDEDVLRSLMRQADEVLADVQNYGVLSPEQVEKKKEMQTAEPEQTEATAGTAQQQPGNGAVIDETPPDDITPGEEPETVICPNCGECIPLD